MYCFVSIEGVFVDSKAGKLKSWTYLKQMMEAI